MKKIDFMSPEALLQAEIFGSGGNSSIQDVSNAIYVNTGGRATQGYSVFAFYNPTLKMGLFYVNFVPLSSNCSISIINAMKFNEVYSSNSTVSFNNNMIEFSEVELSSHISVCGAFSLQEDDGTVVM